MGLQISTVRHIIMGQKVTEWCYPVSPYIPFPKDEWPAGQDGLLTDLHILPEKLHRLTDDGSWYWWSDAQFVPFKDTYLFATTAAYMPRPTQHWVAVSHMPNGKVLLYQLDSAERMKCNIYSRTNCSVLPKISPHPLGEMVGYCGTGEVVIMSMNGDRVYSQSRDLSNAVHIYCAVANNGVSFACLKRGMGVFFLECHSLDASMMRNDSIRCHKVCPGFIPTKTMTDCAVCKFSPDCQFIAVSSIRGYLFVVRRTRLEKFCIVCPDMVEGALSSVHAFDYHPRYPFEVISLSTSDGTLQTISIDTGEVLVSTETDNSVDCLTYSRDGLFIAVGFHNFDIIIFRSEDLTAIHSIPMSSLCQDHVQRVPAQYPAILQLSFSQNGEHLASTSCDGHIRLWRIPRVFSLQEICRDKILTSLPIKHVKKLTNIPEKMKNFLLYKYI